MLPRRSYPAGVPCWIDLIQPDPDATAAFYRDLFGWSYEVRTPEGAPASYAYARLDGLVVAAVGGPPGGTEPTGWTTYVTVDSADETAARVTSNGGTLLSSPDDIPRAGRVATCLDPFGAAFGVWQPGDLKGVELVNAPGSWNFSVLDVDDPGAAQDFYGGVFGWRSRPLGVGGFDETWMLRVEGYGDFLADSDPAIREVQAAGGGPEGFVDAVALLTRGGGPASWGTTFAVADADAAFARATELGARVVTPLFDTDYTRQGTVEDPQGAVLTLSEYRPPDA
jgi:predicted enzyme related to lactoylglutathione lyase